MTAVAGVTKALARTGGGALFGLSARCQKTAERALEVLVPEPEPTGLEDGGLHFGAREQERVGQFRPE